MVRPARKTKNEGQIFAQEVGNAFKAYMRKNGVTQLVLAEKTGLAQGNIAQWLKGRPQMPLDVAHAMSKALDVPLDRIFRLALQQTHEREQASGGETEADKRQLKLAVEDFDLTASEEGLRILRVLEDLCVLVDVLGERVGRLCDGV